MLIPDNSVIFLDVHEATNFLFLDNAFIISKSESIFLAEHQGHFPTGSNFFLVLLQEAIPRITEFYCTYRRMFRDIPILGHALLL